MLWTILTSGFGIAFLHAAIPTHWLPFVLAGRGQGWTRNKTLGVTLLAGLGHVAFTSLLGVLVVWLGIETSAWTGEVFPFITGGILIAVGLYYVARQVWGKGHGHRHFGKRTGPAEAYIGAEAHGGGHDHDHAHHHDHDHGHRKPRGAAAPNHLRHVAASASPTAARIGQSLPVTATVLAKPGRSDRAVILGLLAFLTFSPCEGFLPVYLSGISFGWSGFLLLTVVLALATVAGMVLFTWLTLAGFERYRFNRLAKFESAILGGALIGLGVGVMAFDF